MEAYYKAQGMFRHTDTPDPVFTDIIELDLSSVVPSLAGPKRPQRPHRAVEYEAILPRYRPHAATKADTA